MFNAKSRVYLSGPGLAGTYQHAGIINEDTANVVKSIATVTILEALAFAFEGPHASESWADAFISNTGSEDESSSKSGLSKGELIALQQIVEVGSGFTVSLKNLGKIEKRKRVKSFQVKE